MKTNEDNKTIKENKKIWIFLRPSRRLLFSERMIQTTNMTSERRPFDRVGASTALE